MGQKTHPQGFRLVTTQKHLSSWYANKFTYKNFLYEDDKIRLKMEKCLNKILKISKINLSIVRNERVEIFIYALFPTEMQMAKILPSLEKDGNINSFSELKERPTEYEISPKYSLKEGINISVHQYLQETIQNLQKETGKILTAHITLIENQFDDANLIAKFIAEQLEQRIPFRRILKQALNKIQEVSKKGVKIQISGRLNGTDIARSEWKREGKVPLHTLKAKIDYAHQIAYTSAGIIGIKVWLFES